MPGRGRARRVCDARMLAGRRALSCYLPCAGETPCVGLAWTAGDRCQRLPTAGGGGPRGQRQRGGSTVPQPCKHAPAPSSGAALSRLACAREAGRSGATQGNAGRRGAMRAMHGGTRCGGGRPDNLARTVPPARGCHGSVWRPRQPVWPGGVDGQAGWRAGCLRRGTRHAWTPTPEGGRRTPARGGGRVAAHRSGKER